MRSDQTAHAISVHRVTGIDDPWFDKGFSKLDQYFGSRGEMETRAVIAQRLRWNPADRTGDYSQLYEMAVLTDADNDIAAVGDYSVILSRSAIASGQAAVVHLSHIWVNPHKPGRGIVNRFMHELTVDAARRALQQAELPITSAITLAAEMEPIVPNNEERLRRIKRFLLGGLRLVDPTTLTYLQPDFRTPEDIDRSGASQPLHLYLMLRRVERETEAETTVGEIRHIAQCLYHMYAQGIRPQDMAPAYRSLNNYPPDDSLVQLLNRLPRPPA